jgi:UDP-glucose:(heptosyl)LPS alpha-1,3-glucosyltransferase
MRLAIIRQRYTPYGGAERFVEGALEALLERNVAISLYTREWPQTKLQLIEPVVVDPFYLGRLWRDWGFARAVCRHIADAKANLVQSHERLLCCDVYRAGDGVHAVWLEHKLAGASALTRAAAWASPYHRYVLARERELFASPWLRAVICNSKMVRDEIRDHFGLPESRLPVIYNAVDSDAFHPRLRAERAKVLEQHAIAEDATVFLLVGSNYERKGVATAIEAIAELPQPARLVVVGRDKRHAHYARIARRHGVADRVTIVGPVGDPRPYFGAADAFVLPTLYDPCPNAALEAMACALPVATSTKSGVAELLIEHDAGFVAPSRDAAALAQNMRALLDVATRERLGANARKAVLPLTPEAMTLQLVLLYRDLLASTVKPKTVKPYPSAAGDEQTTQKRAVADSAPAPAAAGGDEATTQPPASGTTAERAGEPQTAPPAVDAAGDADAAPRSDRPPDATGP